MSPRADDHRSYKLVLYTAALLTTLLPVTYMRLIKLWEWEWTILPLLLLSMTVASIAMVFSYQNLAITRYARAGGPSLSGSGSARRRKERMLESVALYGSMAVINLAYIVLFLLLRRFMTSEPFSFR